MELTPIISFIGIALATAVSFYFIHRPIRRQRRLAALYARLNWEQGNAPGEPRNAFRIRYHA